MQKLRTALSPTDRRRMLTDTKYVTGWIYELIKTLPVAHGVARDQRIGLAVSGPGVRARPGVGYASGPPSSYSQRMYRHRRAADVSQSAASASRHQPLTVLRNRSGS